MSATEIFAGISAVAAVVGVIVAIRAKLITNQTESIVVTQNGSGNLIVGDGDINIGIDPAKLESILSRMEDGQDEWKRKYEEVMVSLRGLRSEINNKSEVNEAILQFNNGNFKRAIDIRKQYADEHQREISKAKNNYYELGNLYLLDFDYVSALSNYEAARRLSDDRNEYALDIAMALVKVGDVNRAEVVLLENANSAEQYLSMNLVSIYATEWLHLIEFYISQGAFEKAQINIDNIRPILDENDSSGILEDVQNKIYALSSRERDGAVERLSRLEERWGRYSPEIIEPANILAQSYDADGKHDEAEVVYIRILEIIRSSRTEIDQFNRGIIHINYVFNQFSLHKPELIERSLDTAIQALGLEHPTVATILPKAIQKYINIQSFDEARKYGLILLNILQINEQENEDKIAETQQLLGNLERI